MPRPNCRATAPSRTRPRRLIVEHGQAAGIFEPVDLGLELRDEPFEIGFQLRDPTQGLIAGQLPPLGEANPILGQPVAGAFRRATPPRSIRYQPSERFRQADRRLLKSLVTRILAGLK